MLTDDGSTLCDHSTLLGRNHRALAERVNVLELFGSPSIRAALVDFELIWRLELFEEPEDAL